MAISFSLGAGLENQTIFADLVGGTWDGLLDNGMLIGALTAILMTVFLDLTTPRRGGRLQVKLDISTLPEIDRFVRELAAGTGWDDDSTERLRLVAEESLLSLIQASEDHLPEEAPRLIIVARPDERMVEMEFMAGLRRGEPGRPAGILERRDRGPGNRRGIASSIAASRIVRAAPEILRLGYRHRAGEGLAVWRRNASPLRACGSSRPL